HRRSRPGRRAGRGAEHRAGRGIGRGAGRGSGRGAGRIAGHTAGHTARRGTGQRMTAEAAAETHRIGLRRLLTLLSGRAAFRLLLYGSAVVLVAAWSREDFSRYAAAVGAVGWLSMVVQSGPEKAALTLVPRARRTREQLAGMLRAAVAYVPLPFTLTAVAALLLAPGATVTLYLLAVAYYVGLGCGMLGVAVHRALGGY